MNWVPSVMTTVISWYAGWMPGFMALLLLAPPIPTGSARAAYSAGAGERPVLAPELRGRWRQLVEVVAGSRVGRVGAEHIVRRPLLLLRQRAVQRLEHRNELLHILSALLLDLRERLHVVDRRHRRELAGTLLVALVHLLGIVAHHLGELFPLLA